MDIVTTSRRRLALRVIVFLVAASVVVIGGCMLWQTLFFKTGTTWLKENWRGAQYIPEYVEELRMSWPNEEYVRAGKQDPHYTFVWLMKYAEWEARPSSIVITLSLEATEREIDLGGERERVEVDGGQGWLSRLSAEDFVTPLKTSEAREEYRYARNAYDTLLRRRSGTGSERLEGPIITLQWNKDGIHYLLVGRDREPVTVDDLLKMANSFAPAEFPYPWGSR